MAAAISAINAKIRSRPVLSYFCSTRTYTATVLISQQTFLREQVPAVRELKTDDIVPLADFWGPASNFGIPIAAVMDTQKDPEMCVCLFFKARSSVGPRPLSFPLRLFTLDEKLCSAQTSHHIRLSLTDVIAHW